MFENDAQLGETVVKDEVPNLKNFDQRLRDEAHEDISLEVPQERYLHVPHLVNADRNFLDLALHLSRRFLPIEHHFQT